MRKEQQPPTINKACLREIMSIHKNAPAFAADVTRLIVEFTSDNHQKLPSIKELSRLHNIDPRKGGKIVRALDLGSHFVESDKRKKKEAYKHKNTNAFLVDAQKVIKEFTSGVRKTLPAIGELTAPYGMDPKTGWKILNELNLSHYFAESRTLKSKEREPEFDRVAIITALETGLKNYESGLSSSMSSFSKIAETFGCHTSLVAQIAWADKDLNNRLKAARKKIAEAAKEKIVLQKTPTTAWFLGALFSSGSLKVSDKSVGVSTIILTNKDSDVLQAVKEKGEQIIGKEGLERNLGDRKNPSIVFNHIGYAQLLGPFSLESRTKQMLKTYEWVREKKYLKSFVKGLFDAGGMIYFEGKHRRISFAVNSEELADYYVSTLRKLGIERPRIEREKGKPKRVFFGTIPDLKKFAEEIKSESKPKQHVLNTILAYEANEAELRIRGNRAKPKQIFP